MTWFSILPLCQYDVLKYIYSLSSFYNSALENIKFSQRPCPDYMRSHTDKIFRYKVMRKVMDIFPQGWTKDVSLILAASFTFLHGPVANVTLQGHD